MRRSHRVVVIDIHTHLHPHSHGLVRPSDSSASRAHSMARSGGRVRFSLAVRPAKHHES